MRRASLVTEQDPLVGGEGQGARVPFPINNRTNPAPGRWFGS
jgi:hypothetical protein